MCGIVGLLVKNPKMRDSIGELMLPMLIGMTDRGPDSAGLAIFGSPIESLIFGFFTSNPTIPHIIYSLQITLIYQYKYLFILEKLNITFNFPI